MASRDLLLHACSRGMAGTLTPGLLDEKVDENGTCFKDAAASAGYRGKSHGVRSTKLTSLSILVSVANKLLCQMRACFLVGMLATLRYDRQKCAEANAERAESCDFGAACTILSS